jgi:hypothetical protein
MRIVVSGELPENLMIGVKHFAEDVGASVRHVDKDATPAYITVAGEGDSGFAGLLGEMSKIMRMFGVAK